MLRPIIQKFEHLDHDVTREELHEKAIAFTEEQFARKGSVPFMWALVQGSHVAWVETPWEDEREKVAATRTIHQMMFGLGATAYSFISEIWTCSFSIEQHGEKEFKRLNDFATKHGVCALPPNLRDDAVMITTFDRSPEYNFSQFLVTMRPPNRGLNFLGPRVDKPEGKDGQMSGRMWNLLRQPLDDRDLLNVLATSLSLQKSLGLK